MGKVSGFGFEQRKTLIQDLNTVQNSIPMEFDELVKVRARRGAELKVLSAVETKARKAKPRGVLFVTFWISSCLTLMNHEVIIQQNNLISISWFTYYIYFVSQDYSESPNSSGFLSSHLNWTSRCLAISKRSATRQPASAAVFHNVSYHGFTCR